ncbi:MAG: YifB family Mg chelatase-like AAA ATPase [Christensenellales bacterium]
MFTTIKSFALDGISGYPVDVEVCAQKGLPSLDMVGLAAGAVKEAKERMRSAIKNSGFDFGSYHTVINLAPADVKKDGSALDLAIAVGYLTSTGSVPYKRCGEYVFLGELGLDGALRKINGVMPIIISALQSGLKKFVIPYGNAKEASFVADAEVYALRSLTDVVNLLIGMDIKPVQKAEFDNVSDFVCEVDMADIKGQSMAKRALEIAVSGAHNMLMCGSPGTGKTMLAKCVTGIMPAMTFEEAIEVTKIHSVSGLINEEEGIISRRPFRSPHHTASLPSITGGGRNANPGEVSLAHNGVLFLDEMPEYPRKTLEALRQPLEDGVITVSRINRTVEYPADFMLIASMNPCPCGYYGSSVKKCTCTPREILNYVSKISGPLLDRIDIYVTVDNVEYGEFRSRRTPESSATVRERVERAREIQRKRFADYGIYTNAQMNNSLIKKFCVLDDESETMLGRVFSKHNLSPRATTRILKTARTIADLSGGDRITYDDLAEAIQYKTVDKKELTVF